VANTKEPASSWLGGQLLVYKQRGTVQAKQTYG
jgi:hypothetical protein